MNPEQKRAYKFLNDYYLKFAKLQRYAIRAILTQHLYDLEKDSELRLNNAWRRCPNVEPDISVLADIQRMEGIPVRDIEMILELLQKIDW